MGDSGRVYAHGEVLQRRQDPKLNIFKARSGNEYFVFKRVPKPCCELSQRFAAEFTGSRQLRMQLDSNREEHILIYPYFRDTLLALTKSDPDLSVAWRKGKLHCVGEALPELHSKNWIHIYVKPDDVLVNWSSDEDDIKTIGDVALGDFDIASKAEKLRETPSQSQGIYVNVNLETLLVQYMYVFGGGTFLILSSNEYQALPRYGITPERAMLTQYFIYFGPVNKGILRQVYSEVWGNTLKSVSHAAELAREENGNLRFEHWGQDLGLAMRDVISGMVKPDPTARLTMDQVMAHPYWQEGAEEGT
ncbi:hypothetical protein B0T19DRAFT_441503 [Cercophora scortea]|uniref:Protein kinase domain-containing protein n=1 Tax=Cercophora scortea TaxID=314031 RepID=A0AAE0IM86_9PEZI|nr:hypothetical protein B0T19DRAFT_441503 [Cercophora scortea]